MRYFWRNGQFVDRDGNPMQKPFEGEICRPIVMRDIPEYTSPIDGTLITSRSQRREDLKRNNCVEWDPAFSPTRGKPEFKNPHFCAKRGLQVAERYRS